MRKLLLITFLLACNNWRLLAQDAIYTANGNRLDNARITGLTEDKIRFKFQNVERSFLRQNILFAFSNTGHFLLVSELNSDLAKAQQQLQDFLTAPVQSGSKDYLVNAVPLAVISADISYVSDDVVNYKTQSGSPASIPKRELVAILYHDGRHAILRDPVEVAGLLPEIRNKLNQGTQSTAQTAVTKPEGTVSETKDESPSPQVQPNVVNITNIIPSPSNPAPTSTNPSATSNGKLSLDEAEYQTYRKKALQKVDEFVAYLNVITDKSRPTDDKDQAINEAAKLFMPAATIEVTSKNKPGSRRYPIRDYLTRLKLLPYSSAKIEWSEVQYLKELSQAADGNYYGVITGEQTFIGYGKQGDNVIYTDVVQKNVRVKLQSYTKEVEGRSLTNWGVLLGSIGVKAQ